MRYSLKYFLLVISFISFVLLSCNKTIVEPKSENEFLSPPPPLCLSGGCNVADAGGFFGWFAWGTSSYEGELHYELSVHGGPFDFTYDQNGNPTSCKGFVQNGCYSNYRNSTFTYTNGKLSSILVDNTFSPYSCPPFPSWETIHTGTRLDFTYSYRVEQMGGIPLLFPVTNVTVLKSDTVLLGQNFNSFNPTGRTYYYEYGLSGDKLRVKRYKANASALIKEVRYTYDSIGRVTRWSQYDNGVEKSRAIFYSFDSKKNFASGNSITKLLTSTYGINNPKQWYIHYYPNNSISYYDAVYQYNGYCYPKHVDITLNGFTHDYIDISYSCN